MIYCEYLSFLDLVQNDIKAWLIIQFSSFSKSRNYLKDTSKSARFQMTYFQLELKCEYIKSKASGNVQNRATTCNTSFLSFAFSPHPILNLSGTRTPSSAPSFNHRNSAALCTPAVHVAVHLAYIDFCSSAESAQLFLYRRKVIPPLHQQWRM